VPHDDVPHDDVPHNDVPHDDVPHDYVQHDDVPHYDVPHNDVPHNDVPHDYVQHDDVPHDLYSSSLKKPRKKKWACLLARLVQLCCTLNSSGKLDRRDREWKFVREWWDRIKVITLSMGMGKWSAFIWLSHGPHVDCSKH
jgi:hypothetical protein